MGGGAVSAQGGTPARAGRQRAKSRERGAGSAEQGAKIETDPRPLTPDPQGEADACFLKAIAIARKQQAKSLELRATVSLARLWQRQGRQREAHEMLAEIYGWFTEGFDTVDLQEAKALLDELASPSRSVRRRDSR